MSDSGFGTVQVVECSSYEEAMSRAGRESANTMGIPVPVIMFRQGLRWNLSGALPYSFVVSRLESHSASKKSPEISDIQGKTNRPEDPSHSETIADYMKNNVGGKYILPPLTLNIQESVQLYAGPSTSSVKSGYLVIPHTAKLAITDGQHRRSGIIRALEKMGEEDRQRLEGDGIGVMITCETERDQIHQDFADCSKTKQLPPSQLAVFDRRNPANKLVLDISEKCQLFKGRIDAVNKTLGKKSNYLFLANQLRQMVKILLFGNWQMADADFEKKAIQMLDPETYERELQWFVKYIDFLTEVIPVWKQISALKSGVQSNKISDLRTEEGFICLRAVGLVIIAKIGHELNKEQVEWEHYASRLGTVNWSKTAPIWEGNLVSSDGKILTNQKLVREATIKVRQAIGWEPKRVVEEEADATVDALSETLEPTE